MVEYAAKGRHENTTEVGSTTICEQRDWGLGIREWGLGESAGAEDGRALNVLAGRKNGDAAKLAIADPVVGARVSGTNDTVLNNKRGRM